MTKTEINYLQIAISGGGTVKTRQLRNSITHIRTGKQGMSALGGVCKVLRRLERAGFLESVNPREEYQITDAGRAAVGLEENR